MRRAARSAQERYRQLRAQASRTFVPLASAHTVATYGKHIRGAAMPVETFDGQITRANVQLGVRSGVLTEEEAARYWQTRRRFRTLSDSNSKKTIAAVTQEFKEAKACVLERMNTSTSDLLARERGEKRRLEAEVLDLKRRLAGVCARP